MPLLRTITLSFCAIALGCDSKSGYVAAVDAWHEGRVQRLQASDGWFSLAGLYWFKQGENTFGAADTNDLVFPDTSFPAYLGSFFVHGDSVTARFAPGTGVQMDDMPPGEARLKSDVEGEPTIMSHGSYSWYVIDRDGVLGIRLKDDTRAARSGFEGIERFPVDPSWRIRGEFLPYDPPRTVVVPTVMNIPSRMTAAGAVEFELNGGMHRLEAMGEPGDEQFWIIFADATNRDETYPAGRYVYIKAPDADGDVDLDFNQAYNPPCAFSKFATCPFPPPQNRLDFRIEAGEKRYEQG